MADKFGNDEAKQEEYDRSFLQMPIKRLGNPLTDEEMADCPSATTEGGASRITKRDVQVAKVVGQPSNDNGKATIVHIIYAIIKEEDTTHFEKGRHDVSVRFAVMYYNIAQLLNKVLPVDTLKFFLDVVSHQTTNQLYINRQLYRRCETTVEVLKTLHPRHINAMDTRLLRKIVLKFGNDEAKQQLEEYYRSFPQSRPGIKRLGNQYAVLSLRREDTRLNELNISCEFSIMYYNIAQLLNKVLPVDTLKFFLDVVSHQTTNQLYINRQLYRRCETTVEVLKSLHPRHINAMDTRLLRKIVLKFGNDEAKQQLEEYYRSFPQSRPGIKRLGNPLTDKEMVDCPSGKRVKNDPKGYKSALMQEEIAKKDQEIAKLKKQLAKKDDQLSKQEEELANVGEHSDSMKLHEIELLETQVEELTRVLENRPTSHDQAIQTEEGTSMDVITTDYLRGMDIVAETTFYLTGRRQTHVWEGHGLRLHVPEGVLPPDHTGCRVDVRASLAGQFEFPEGSHPVSGMYWLSCKETFLLPITLELQHCAVVEDAAQCSRLRFAIAKCSQPELPYKFRSLDRGVFTLNSFYGSISLSQFSIVVVTKQTSEGDNGTQEPQQDAYYARLFYIHKTVRRWQLDFTITQDLELFHKHVTKYYAAECAQRGPHLPVEFEDDAISLDIPDDKTVVGDGWKITPLTPPLITKKRVDGFGKGKEIPTCQVYLRWIKDESPVELIHTVNLQGAKEPYNYVCLATPTDGGKRKLEDIEQENGPMKKRMRNDSAERESSAESSSSTRTLAADTLLTQVNKSKVVQYLKRIGSNDDLLRLGEELGLDGSVLRKRITFDTFLDDLVREWLERKDRVDEVGKPSWRKLVEVLREVRQNGLANDIEEKQF